MGKFFLKVIYMPVLWREIRYVMSAKLYLVITRAIAFILFVGFISLGSGCGRQNEVDASLDGAMPRTILWAWERPEDLTFADPAEFGVAFLAQTIYLSGSDVLPKPRRQPLAVSPGAYVIAVTRVETTKETAFRPKLDSEMAVETASLIVGTMKLPDVRAVQVDFDAVVSEREFYSRLMAAVRARLPVETPLTMTSLASWCTGDAWFNDFPVAEAVPMVFHMGADSDKIRTFLKNGNDWDEPLCRGSYGLLLGGSDDIKIVPGRRIYYFKDSAWRPGDIQALK